MCQLTDLADHLHTGRARAHHDEGEQPASLVLVLGELGQLETTEDPAPEFEGVVDGLHAGGVALEVVVSEIGLVGAGRDDQAVVRQVEIDVPGHGVDHPAGHIDSVHLTEGDRDVLVLPQDQARGGRDVADRQDPGRHLVEQRLEEVMAGLGDQRDVHVRFRQGLCRTEPAEARADDDDSMPTTGILGAGVMTVRCIHDGTPDLGCSRPERYPHLAAAGRCQAFGTVSSGGPDRRTEPGWAERRSGGAYRVVVVPTGFRDNFS